MSISLNRRHTVQQVKDGSTRSSMRHVSLKGTVSVGMGLSGVERSMSLRRRSIYEMVAQKLLHDSLQTVEDGGGNVGTNADYDDPISITDDVRLKWKHFVDDKNHQIDINEIIVKGIPKNMRSSCWNRLSNWHLELEKFDEIPDVSRYNYRKMSQESNESKDCQIVRDIEQDIHRTFPNLSFFQNETGRKKLFNLLKVYAMVDQEVGYCQGIAFVAGVLLMHSTTGEFEAFQHLLKLMYGYGLRLIYLPGMDRLQMFIYQTTRLLDTNKPNVLEHLIVNNVMPDFFASSWLLTLFASHFPIDFTVRIFGNLIVQFF